MIDKFSQALTLMREAFADAQTGAVLMPSLDLAAEVDGAQQVINAAAAVQTLRVAQYAGRDEEKDNTGAWVDVDHGLGHVSEFASDCFGPMLAMGHIAADRKVHTAAALAARLPLTLAAMSAGDLDWWRASIIATQLSEASAPSCAAVEALLFPAVLGEAPGAVTKRVRRVLGRVDADALRIKAAKERLDRFVHAYPSHVPGLTTWVASLPAADSAACWAAIDDLAHRMHGDDPARTLEQCRADALVDLMLTNVTVSTTVSLMIPVQTATVDEPDGSLERDLIVRDQKARDAAADADRDQNARDAAADADRDQNARDAAADADRDQNARDAAADAGQDTSGDGRSATAGSGSGMGSAFGWLDPLALTDDFGQPTPEPNPMIEPTWTQIAAMGFEIPGIGVIGGDVVAGILDKFDTRITRVLLDERTGITIETSIEEYLPNAAMRRFLHKRDGTCRFPGCARNAKRCEPDHVIPYSRGGPTAPYNLACLCKHHHRVKHDASWKLVMTREGHCTWTDPHGRQYATHPVNHHEMAA